MNMEIPEHGGLPESNLPPSPESNLPPSPAEIATYIQRTETTLTRLRAYPFDWTSKNGEQKDTIESRLESSLEDLRILLESSPNMTPLEPPLTEATRAPFAPTITNPAENTSHVLPPGEGRPNTETADHSTVIGEQQDVTPEREPQAQSERAQFFEVNGVYIPVMPRTSGTATQWEAVPGKMKVSGGHKFSEVLFVRDDPSGLSATAKPGEKMDFSEGTRGKRLESIDTILEGRYELKAFNEIYQELADKIDTYKNLNPDEPEYNIQASQLASDIDRYTNAEGLRNLLPEAVADKIADVDDFLERVADIIRTVQYLREVDEGGTEFIPPLDQNYKMTPFIKRKFAEFSQLVNRQMGIGNNAYLQELVNNEQTPDWEQLSAKGMTIMVGPRGTGKNKLVDHYATIANRPLFRYACSPDKEERDLTYDVELSDGEVVKVPTRILTAIATENSILELDEINLLRPNVAKFFNSLFDGDRSVFLNDQVIKAAKGVVFVGLMNPADYNGVEDLPETIDDRSNIMTMGYPPLKDLDRNTGAEVFTYDEALILKNNISALQNTSDAQFIQLWDRVVNDKGQVAVDPETAKIIRDLKNIILIANRTRQTVEAYKTRSGDARMERDISLRGTSEAAKFYSENHLWRADLSKMPGWKAPYNAAQYAISQTYLPHTETYRKGNQDSQAIERILSEGIAA